MNWEGHKAAAMGQMQNYLVEIHQVKVETLDDATIENTLMSEDAEARGIETGMYLDDFFEHIGRE